MKRASSVFQFGLELHEATALATLLSVLDETVASLASTEALLESWLVNVLSPGLYQVPWSRCSELLFILLPS